MAEHAEFGNSVKYLSSNRSSKVHRFKLDLWDI